MAYASIVKLKKFTGKENDTQVWLNDMKKAIVANGWDDTKHIHPMHSVDLQAAVTNARDFEADKLKANHTQAINLVMNGSSELDSKLKQFKDTQLNNPETNQQSTLTSNISPAIITENELLDAIFPFELKELLATLLFSEAALKEKPITAIYTNAKVDGHPIKLILDNRSAGSIITQQLMDQLGRQIDQAASARIITANGVTKTLIGKINDLPIKINGIIISIKVLVIEAIQYQALVGNDWLSKTNTMLDWIMQELQFSQDTMCDHFKTTTLLALLIEFEEEKEKPTWKAYQVAWTDEDHNKLSLILSWNDKGKGK
ncbi:hypothetical protein G9A89_021605 [Geosiphon pyriformis]|nr:hypothetical protein G9A89_021605 [Geosiphon pyriformis]